MIFASIIAALVSFAVGEKLNNVYLPPAYAKTSGGSANFLTTPLQSSQNYQSRNHYSSRPTILRFNNDNDGLRSYKFDYETDNRISQHEVGNLRNLGADQEAVVVRGSYSYAGSDGQVYTVDYIADENGFQPSGAHLPTPPPIPEAILKSLQENAASQSGGNYNNGQYQQYNTRSDYNTGYRY